MPAETTLAPSQADPDTKEFKVLSQFLMSCADMHMDGGKMVDAMAYLVARAHAPAPQVPAVETEAKAARWDWMCRHWKTLNVRFNKDGRTLKGLTLTLDANVQGAAGSPRLDSVVDQAIKEEATHSITGGPPN